VPFISEMQLLTVALARTEFHLTLLGDGAIFLKKEAVDTCACYPTKWASFIVLRLWQFSFAYTNNICALRKCDICSISTEFSALKDKGGNEMAACKLKRKGIH